MMGLVCVSACTYVHLGILGIILMLISIVYWYEYILWKLNCCIPKSQLKPVISFLLVIDRLVYYQSLIMLKKKRCKTQCWTAHGSLFPKLFVLLYYFWKFKKKRVQILLFTWMSEIWQLKKSSLLFLVWFILFIF